MNFLELQNEVITNRFSNDQRPQVKNWLNYRYGRLWAMEDWSFKKQILPLSVSGNATSVAKGVHGDIIRIWDTTTAPGYAPMLSLRAEDLWDSGRSVTSGTPYDFTVVGNTIYFERPLDTNRSYWVLSTIPFTALANDSDTPLIPSEFHQLLVAGATAMGLMKENDPASQAFEQDWDNGIQDMKSAYLTSQRTAYDSYPDWP